MLRYWDGRVWTEHIAPAQPPAAPVQQPMTQPMPQLAPQPAQPVPYAPYAAAPTQAGPTTPDGQPLAGWWARVGAFLIDGVAVGVVGSIASIPGQIGFQRDLEAIVTEFTDEVEANPDATPDFSTFFSDLLDVFQEHALWLIVPSLLVTIIYSAGMLRWKGATLGKLALGLQVRLRERPGTLPWATIAIRVATHQVLPNMLIWLGLLSGSIGTLVLCYLVAVLYGLLDPLWAAWDSKRQAIHDKLAATNVIKTR